MAGVATVTASAGLIAPSVQPAPLPRPEPAIQLMAAVQQPDEPGPRLLQILLSDPARLLGPAVPVGTISPPPAPIQFAIAPNIADTIDGIYIAVEPWVEYGFQVAADLLGWVPWVGWLSGQIMVFYRFGEGIVASGVFNFTDWLRGDEGAIPNLVDFGLDVGRAFVWLGIDEWNYFLPPLPPLPIPRPPRPPAEGPFLALESLMGPTATSSDEVANAGNPVDAALNPVTNGIGNGTGLLRNAIAQIPLVSDIAEASVSEAAGETVEDVGVTAGAARSETRVNPAREIVEAAKTVGNGVVRAQGEVRRAADEATNDVGATRTGKPDKVAEDVAKGPATVAKNVGDTVTKVAKDVRQTAKDARGAVKDRSADEE